MSTTITDQRWRAVLAPLGRESNDRKVLSPANSRLEQLESAGPNPTEKGNHS